MSLLVVPVRGTSATQVAIPPSGGTVVNPSTSSTVTISTTETFQSTTTYTLQPGSSTPIKVGPLYARTTKGGVVTVVVLDGLLNIAGNVSYPQISLATTVGINGSRDTGVLSTILKTSTTDANTILTKGTYRLWLWGVEALPAVGTYASSAILRVEYGTPPLDTYFYVLDAIGLYENNSPLVSDRLSGLKVVDGTVQILNSVSTDTTFFIVYSKTTT